jgi:hypothetical protein
MPATCAGWVVPSTDAASDTTPGRLNRIYPNFGSEEAVLE